MEAPIVSRKYFIWMGLAAAHLILVVFGAAHSFPHGPNPLLSAIGYYGTFSGAHAGYGFFAPGVGTSMLATYEITDAAGNLSRAPVDPGRSREATLRINNIVSKFWETGDKRLHRALTASWAGKAFARFPKAEKVAVRLETYYLPSMGEYHAGKRPTWLPFYEAKFVHKPKSRGEQKAE